MQCIGEIILAAEFAVEGPVGGMTLQGAVP